MQEIVKYNNDFNKVRLPSFTEQEQNLLFGIFSRLKDNPSVILTSVDFRDILGSDYTIENMIKFVKSLHIKFLGANLSYIEKLENGKFAEKAVNFFDFLQLVYTDDERKNFEYLEIALNQRFIHILQGLQYNFTRFELNEFISLSGKYTKTLYRLLKQYRQTGYFKMDWQEFLEIMDIPQTYKMCDIEKQILKPALKELTRPRNLFEQIKVPFEALQYTKIKGRGRGRGGKVISIEFSFKPQKREDTYILTKSQEIQKLRAENSELAKEAFEGNLHKTMNEELREKIAELEKISCGIGLNGYCGLRFFSNKKEELCVKKLEKIVNSSDNNQFKATIKNETKRNEFAMYFKTIQHFLNLIKKNEYDFYPYNVELLAKRFNRRGIW